jgi:L-aminopeptidase/D-esterase-like protein
MQPGARNLITDVEGILVGNAEDHDAASGVTVVLPQVRCVAGADVRGGAPGTREIDALDPTCLVDAVDAVVLSGGSAFGLDAAGGVMSWLAARGRGYAIRDVVVPIVPSAILFDLLNGGNKAWGEMPPYRQLGRDAVEAAAETFALGNAGAGYGAQAGTLGAGIKGGLGSASIVSDDGLQVGALVAVNAVGSPVMPGSTTLWAWPFERNGEMGGQSPPGAVDLSGEQDLQEAAAGENTTIGVVATNAFLDKAQARRVAIMAQDGYARALRPVHTPFDGDTVFCLATGARAQPVTPDALSRIGALAADCMARAVGRAIWEARSLLAMSCYRDWADTR